MANMIIRVFMWSVTVFRIADSDKLNGTIPIPAFMQEGILQPFKNIESIISRFCATLKDHPHDPKSDDPKSNMVVSSEELMELWRFFPYYYNGVGLTRLNTTFVVDNNTLFTGGSLWLRFMSLLWAQPQDHIVEAGMLYRDIQYIALNLADYKHSFIIHML
jgi:hypothetical protein